MEPKSLKPKKGPEKIIQDALIHQLTLLGWYVKSTHGNIYQFGFPDLYACKKTMGSRWIEVKEPNRKGNPFEKSQLEVFHRFAAEGVGVWVLTGYSHEDIKKLEGPANWWQFLNYGR